MPAPITTFQQLAVLSENRVTVVPPDTDFEICCLLADTLTTGFGVINNDAEGEDRRSRRGHRLRWHRSRCACSARSSPVRTRSSRWTCTTTSWQVAAEYGATHTINSAKEDFSEAVLKILDGARPDVVVDGTGNPAVLEQAFALAGNFARVVGVGVMPHDRKLSLNTLPLHLGKVLRGSHGGESLPAEDIPRYLRMMRDGRFRSEWFCLAPHLAGGNQ